MTREKGQLLVEIAQMYYLDNKTQSQISKELKIHRSIISRLLKECRENGIVTIKINKFAAGAGSYEKELEEKYKVRKAIVVEASETLNVESRLRLLAEEANNYLKEIIEDTMIIGFSWGSAMSALARGLHDIDKQGLTCVPMVGGPAGRSKSEYHVNTVTFEASQNLNGRALLIDAPALPETLEVKKSLLQNSFNQSLIECWRKMNIAIFGIGSPAIKDSERWNDFYGKDVFQDIEERKVAGDVVSRFFDANGELIPSELDDRVIGIDPADLKRVPYRIGISESTHKAMAIRAAMLGKFANVIVTTADTAEELLK